jgi:class 3 adenylate cyclase
MLERPTGTVTFVFTDVEGSTRLWEEHPDEMQSTLEGHDAILRSSIERCGGYIFSTAGDPFAAAFAGASDAPEAAVDAQRALGAEPWPAKTVIQVRMGLHTGQAQERGGDYFGTVLYRATRVMSVGHGSQILLTAATEAVLGDVELMDLGERQLRDLSGSERLFQMQAEGLRAQFAPLNTVDETPGNLPAPTTSFVGREIELKELCELTRAHRMVTLTGVGGVGKTRLAIQVAAELTTEFPDGVWLLELAPVSDPASVPDAVATVLDITRRQGTTVAATLAEVLSARRTLIVLDNCEHVLDAAADLLELILANSATVKVITTSREGLRVGAEHLWSVPSWDLRAGAVSAAVELFAARAQAVSAAFSLDDEA